MGNATWSNDKTDRFLHVVANAGCAATIHQTGLQYVSDSEFWRWMSECVVKRPGLFDSSEAIRRFALEKPPGLGSLVQGRGMEWDWVRDFNNDPRHILQSARLGTLADDRAGV